jgi:3-oxoadipate enol-lactonase
MAFANINGTALHYEYLSEFEDEPVIVFANSLGTDFRIWLPLIDELTENWSILVYDKRGHGLSDIGKAPYTMEDHAGDLIGLLGHLGIKKAIFCGLSVGGLIVQSIYKQRPDLVEKIILCDTAAKVGTTESWNARIATVTENGIGSIADTVLKMWFTPDFHKNHATELAGYRNMLARQPVEGYAGTCAALRDADFTSAAAAIKVPVLCIVGEQDGSTPPDLVQATAKLIPGARFEIIKNAGHIPCVEQPVALAELLAGFINED